MSAGRFGGRIAVVTGAGHGIGRASARRLGERGRGGGRCRHRPGDRGRDGWPDRGVRAAPSEALAADVSDERGVAELRRRVEEGYNRKST